MAINCKQQQPPTVTFLQVFRTFYRRQRRQALLPPRLSLNHLEFYVDIWSEESLIFSEVVPGPTLQNGSWIPPPGVSDALRFHLEGPEYRMILPVEPRFTVAVPHSVTVSMLVVWKDSNKVACLIDKSVCDYVDVSTYRALAFDYLDFSSNHPFVCEIRAWISLLYLDNSNNEGAIDVFGIELDFCDAANSEEEVLWLLDMLDWK